MSCKTLYNVIHAQQARSLKMNFYNGSWANSVQRSKYTQAIDAKADELVRGVKVLRKLTPAEKRRLQARRDLEYLRDLKQNCE